MTDKFSDSFFPGSVQGSPPTLGKALSVYKDELVRPIAFDLGNKGDSRSLLRDLCQKAVLEIGPASLLPGSAGVVAGELSPVTQQISNPGTVAGAAAGTTTTSQNAKKPPKPPRPIAHNLDDDIKLCVERNRQNVSEVRIIEQERQELIRMPELFKSRILDMDDEITALLAAAQQERQEMEAHIVQRVMLDFTQQHEATMEGMRAANKAEELALQRAFETDERRQLHKQEKSFLGIIENATRKLAKGQACSCRHQYMCRHNKTASYNTRHPSREVLSYRNNAKRLLESGREEEASRWEARANELDAEEEIKWREKVSKSITLNSWGSSVAKVDGKASAHKREIEHLKSAHEVRLVDLAAKQEHKLHLWLVGQRAEQRKLRMQSKRMIREIFARAASDALSRNQSGYSQQHQRQLDLSEGEGEGEGEGNALLSEGGEFAVPRGHAAFRRFGAVPEEEEDEEEVGVLGNPEQGWLAAVEGKNARYHPEEGDGSLDPYHPVPHPNPHTKLIEQEQEQEQEQEHVRAKQPATPPSSRMRSAANHTPRTGKHLAAAGQGQGQGQGQSNTAETSSVDFNDRGAGAAAAKRKGDGKTKVEGVSASTRAPASPGPADEHDFSEFSDVHSPGGLAGGALR